MKLLLKLFLGLIALVVVVIGAGVVSVRQGWIYPSHSKAEIVEATRSFETWVYPDGSGPFPLVIMAHGCGGRTPHHDEWARTLKDAGFATLITDSFTGRHLQDSQEGINKVCNGRALLGPERAADLYVALDEALDNPRIDSDRIGLMGFSHGSWTIIELLGTLPPYGIDEAIERNSKPLGLSPIKASVLLYPYCGLISGLNGIAYKAPILLELAEEDEIVDHKKCMKMFTAAAAQGLPLSLHIAPEAKHAYDVKHWTFAGENKNYRPDLRKTLEQRTIAFFKANL